MSDRSDQEFPPFEHADAGVETDASPEELALHMEEESGEFALEEAYDEGLVDEEELGEELLGAVEPVEDGGDDDEGDDEDDDAEGDDRSVEELDDYVDHQLLELVDDEETDDDRAERGERAAAAANHDDEVVCPSCHLAHHRSAITAAGICRDCAS
jgi:hypothetical protein